LTERLATRFRRFDSVECAVVAMRSQPYELLIADDDAEFRDTLKMVFEPHFRLVEASCGEEAIEIVQRRPIDLALLDMHMNRLTGLETIRAFKSLRSLIPCIIITADPTDDLRQAARTEAFTLLSKPVRKSALVVAVSNALQRAYNDPEAGRWMAFEG
jgi:CheY-like chemotaxis protein